MTIKELREYRAVCVALIQKRQRLANDRRHVYDAVQSASDFPFSKHTVVVEGDVYTHQGFAVMDEIAILRDKKESVERWVQSIDDFTVRRIVEIYFLRPAFGEKPTWEKVADELGDGSTGDSCRMRFTRYMDEKKRGNF